MYVAKQLGCAKETALSYLESLEKNGKVRRVPIDGWFNAWIKIKNYSSFSSWISRDAHGMTITDNGLFEELGIVNVENGSHVMIPYILEFFTQTGYPLDRSVLMLSLTDVEFGVNEIVLKCTYPLNMLCRRDENGHEIYLQTEDGERDDSFTIKVKKWVATT